MARIFVSSAFDEMRKFRDLAAEIIRLAGHEPVTLEHRGADPRPPEIYCAEQVGRCDGFVMLLGHLYGSVDKDQNVSFTEWEHRAAVERRLKRLVFELKLSDDDYLIHQIQRSVLERKTKFEPGTTDWKYERQIQFKGDVRKGVTTRPFESEHEFERLLQQALHEHFPSSNKADEVRKPKTPGGQILVRLCDRVDQLTQFGEQFDRMRQHNVQRPQIYVLFGGEEQRHEACVDRLLCYHINRRFKTSPHPPTAPPKDQRVIEWPSQDCDEIRFNRLRRLVCKALDRDAAVPADYSISALWSRALALKADYVVLLHTLSSDEILASESLIRSRYLAFWDEVDRLAPTDVPRPQFLIFFDVRCNRGATTVGNMLKARLEAIFQCADRSFENTASPAVICLLPELNDIGQADVQRWLTAYSEFLPDAIRDALPSELFPTLSFPIPMHKVERRLKELMGFTNGD